MRATIFLGIPSWLAIVVLKLIETGNISALLKLLLRYFFLISINLQKIHA